eukprot:273040-Amphidinium_carterae.1
MGAPPLSRKVSRLWSQIPNRQQVCIHIKVMIKLIPSGVPAKPQNLKRSLMHSHLSGWRGEVDPRSMQDSIWAALWSNLQGAIDKYKLCGTPGYIPPETFCKQQWFPGGHSPTRAALAI